MLPIYFSRFNMALKEFQMRFSKPEWSQEFTESLINEFSFFSTKIEEQNLEYGETIQFLRGQLVPKENFKSLLEASEHRNVLRRLIDSFEAFELSEHSIKSIHGSLMSNPIFWEGAYKSHLVGNYRNYPVVGNRTPNDNREYAPHYNLEIIMASHIDRWNHIFSIIDNKKADSHLITAICRFHNEFLNNIHPFADGNGRVCRIIMGTLLMKNGCPPIFKKIMSIQDQLEYINTIIACEQSSSNEPLIKFLAVGMAEYLEERLEKEF